MSERMGENVGGKMCEKMRENMGGKRYEGKRETAIYRGEAPGKPQITTSNTQKTTENVPIYRYLA